MNALKMHAVDHPPAATCADHSSMPEAEVVGLAPRMKAALATLLEAIEYARVLGSPAGAELAHELREIGDGHDGRRLLATLRDARLDPASPLPRAPKWDRDRQELRVGKIVVKRFTIPSATQETVLAAFEEKDWPERIDDPLPPRDELSRKARLQETIRSLNCAQKQPLVRFVGDGSGQGILWEFRDDLAASADHRGHDE